MADTLLTEPEEETGSRRMDDELRCLGQMLRMLGDLEEDARARVIAYLSSRFREKTP